MWPWRKRGAACGANTEAQERIEWLGRSERFTLSPKVREIPGPHVRFDGVPGTTFGAERFAPASRVGAAVQTLPAPFCVQSVMTVSPSVFLHRFLPPARRGGADALERSAARAHPIVERHIPEILSGVRDAFARWRSPRVIFRRAAPLRMSAFIRTL
jgi:hypothetical protein